jgi:hypothetical protein
MRKHALALKQFTHENDDCVEIGGFFCGKFSFFEASAIDLGFLVVFWFPVARYFLVATFGVVKVATFRLGFLCFGLLFRFRA